MKTTPYYVTGKWRTGDSTFEVASPYDGSVVASVVWTTDDDAERALASAADVFEESQRLPVRIRAEALLHISDGIDRRLEEIATLIAREGRQATQVGAGGDRTRRDHLAPQRSAGDGAVSSSAWTPIRRSGRERFS